MLLLLFGRLVEDACDLLVALFLGLAGEKYVAAAGLTFAGERLEQILLGLGSFDAFHGFVDLMCVCLSLRCKDT